MVSFCIERQNQKIQTMSQYLILKTFNKPVDLSKIVRIDNSSDWECCVHSYYIKINDSKILRLNCNVIEFDRNIRQPIFMDVLSNAILNVIFLRWKTILIMDLSNFEVKVTNLENIPIQMDNPDTFVMLVFRRKQE